MATDVKKQIAETMEKQARRVGLDKVTVAAIVEDCKISRQAFYYYFQDIVDVARYMLRERLTLTLNSGKSVEDSQRAVRIFAEELTEQFPVISMAIHSKLRGEMELLLIKELKEFFRIVFSKQNCGKDLTEEQILFQSDLLACGIAAYAIEHCSQPSFDAREFSELLWDMLKRAYGES